MHPLLGDQKEIFQSGGKNTANISSNNFFNLEVFSSFSDIFFNLASRQKQNSTQSEDLQFSLLIKWYKITSKTLNYR
jgi:hypothetical protein